MLTLPHISKILNRFLSPVIPASPFPVIPARDDGISFHFMTTFVVKTNVRS
ncbi:hypothetical protein [Wolbachia endosymbiont of Cimex lectularius]|uniref:hypothetical protein n=1 Tax=Wolbachia endosymbiont of Cimex lectularius TaxID=246273 RepID=UPI000AD2AA17|nr:hypothetical protein [Wolbachia endosymbiont of Cimex lectularius]